MRRLLTHLAQFGAFHAQGEVLCTQGLAYLLEDPSARSAFRALIEERARCQVDPELTWAAEVPQADGGRPDLEACSEDGAPLVKIEAKLGAGFGEEQLESYLHDLQRRSGGGVLLVLVPRRRVNEAAAHVSATFDLPGTGPWRVGGGAGSAIAVISWEDTMDSLDVNRSEPFACDRAQFHAMYSVLIGDVIEPITDDTSWREREGAFIELVDRATRELSARAGDRLLPMQDLNGYRARYVYVLRELDPDSAYTVGVRDPFRDYTTPIWMRFNQRWTPNLNQIRDSLRRSQVWKRVVESGREIWIALEVPFDVAFQDQVRSLIREVEEVVLEAYRT